MMKTLKILMAATCLLVCVAATAQEGTINTLTVNPRQNQELTNSTGTASGQPSDAVPGSESQPNGLVPVTSNMTGSGSNGNMTQSTPGTKPPGANAAPEAKSQVPTKPAMRPQKSSAKPPSK
jgi:hypothetical protein